MDKLKEIEKELTENPKLYFFLKKAIEHKFRIVPGLKSEFVYNYETSEFYFTVSKNDCRSTQELVTAMEKCIKNFENCTRLEK